MDRHAMARQNRNLMVQLDRAVTTAERAVDQLSKAQFERGMAEAQLGAALQALKEARASSSPCLASEPPVLELGWSKGVLKISPVALCVHSHRSTGDWHWFADLLDSGDSFVIGKGAAQDEPTARAAAIACARQHAAEQAARWQGVERALGGAP